MNTAKKLVVIGVALVLGMSTAANAAKQKEEDSVYKWGRWAVLSPAAGGQPYVAAITPDAVNNSRPGEADEFQPKVQDEDIPPVQPPVVPPTADDPRDRLPPRANDPRDRLPPRPVPQ